MGRKRRKKIRAASRLWLYITAIVFTIVIAISLLIVGLNSNSKNNTAHTDTSFTPHQPESISKRYYPPVLKSLIVNPHSQTNYFDFILDAGNGNLVNAQELKPEAFNLIKYFFLGLTLPSKEFWINLNPEQPDKTTSLYLSQTDIGKILLEADLKLKQDAANYTDPRTQLGQAYWTKLNQRLREEGLSTNQIPTGTRLWIVPDEIIVEEDDNQVTILSAKLKVCLESEYLQNDSPFTIPDSPTAKIQQINAQVFKATILPTIKHEVNYGQSYAKLRQVYHSLILATCFKQKYSQKANLYFNCINQAHLEGLYSREPWSKQEFFQAYLSSFNQGEYSFYQREYDSEQLDLVQRHYFYGGIKLLIGPKAIKTIQAEASVVVQKQGSRAVIQVSSPIIVSVSNGEFKIKAITIRDEPSILADVKFDSNIMLAKGEVGEQTELKISFRDARPRQQPQATGPASSPMQNETNEIVPFSQFVRKLDILELKRRNVQKITDRIVKELAWADKGVVLKGDRLTLILTSRPGKVDGWLVALDEPQRLFIISKIEKDRLKLVNRWALSKDFRPGITQFRNIKIEDEKAKLLDVIYENIPLLKSIQKEELYKQDFIFEYRFAIKLDESKNIVLNVLPEYKYLNEMKGIYLIINKRKSEVKLTHYVASMDSYGYFCDLAAGKLKIPLLFGHSHIEIDEVSFKPNIDDIKTFIQNYILYQKNFPQMVVGRSLQFNKKSAEGVVYVAYVFKLRPEIDIRKDFLSIDSEELEKLAKEAEKDPEKYFQIDKYYFLVPKDKGSSPLEDKMEKPGGIDLRKIEPKRSNEVGPNDNALSLQGPDLATEPAFSPFQDISEDTDLGGVDLRKMKIGVLEK